jgi:hypothetical protein
MSSANAALKACSGPAILIEGAMAKHIRARPSSISQLPEECEAIVAWAAQELGRSPRPQTEIYEDFKQKLIELKAAQNLVFRIPSFSSFNRHSLRLTALSQRLQRGRAMAASIVAESDGKEADDVSKAATLTLKNLILEMLESGGENGFKPKEALAMAGAMRSLQIAENLSTVRRQKLDTEFKGKVEIAVDTVAKVKGLSTETADAIKAQILGVK